MRFIDPRILLCIPMLLGGCGADPLDQGDTLIVSFQPGKLIVPPAPVAPTSFPPALASAAACQDAGGAVVRVTGIAADGTAASSAQVSLWMSSPSEGRLIPISGNDDGEPQVGDPMLTVVLNDEGRGDACFWPGVTAAQVTVKARSGVVEASESIKVLEREVPTDGVLSLTVTPPEPVLSAAGASASCGEMSLGSCSPGRARRAAIGMTAKGPQTEEVVPEGAIVTLTADRGWLSATDDCNGEPRLPQLQVSLHQSAGTASWCFDDAGGSASLTATSGNVTDTKALVVPALPAALLLTPSAATVPASGVLTLTALVYGCDGKGIEGAPVSFTITQGSMTFEKPMATTLQTAADGTVSVTGNAVEGPLTWQAKIATVPGIGCSSTVEVKP